MAIYSMKKNKLGSFLNGIMKSHELIAPIKTDIARFEKLENASQIKQIYFAENPLIPIKEYFFRKHETIFSFDGKKITVNLEKTRKRVFFGIRRCDLNAIKHQDTVFLDEKNKSIDPYYKAQRGESILIGYHCNEAPSEYCFCDSMDLKDYYDLMFFDKGKEFIVDTGSERGEKFARQFRSFFSQSSYKINEKDKEIKGFNGSPKGTDRLEKKDISGLYDHPDWKKGVDMCLSCAACTSLCPTCYCFEMHDEKELAEPKQSKRVREWSSCQVKDFTNVAGNHVFRDKREERFKHRIYHQLQYFREKNEINLCVGCGRCISGCPTRIDFVKIINEMK